jgi:glycosyltransferase involved in cell wall biosynthesis
MRILMISDFESSGGAALAASRLAQGLVNLGHAVERIVAIPSSNGNPWGTHTISQLRTIPRRVVRRAVPRLGVALDRAGTEKELARIVRHTRPDVINVHNVHYAQFAGWSEQMLRICAQHAPTVWTLHDMWSFTGRCIAAYDCEKFVTGCDATCPTPGEYPALPPARIAAAWRRKHELLAELPDVVCVTPSRWMAAQAGRGLWRNHRIEVIPYGLPLDVYRPGDREAARRALGLEAGRSVALFTAQVITDRRNGADLLLAALRQGPARPITVITVGQGALQSPASGVPVVSLGTKERESDRVLAYNAADFTVYAAPVGNLPNTILESLACGTPAVAMPVCGVPELVRTGTTGWLAPEATAAGLAGALRAALRDLARGEKLRESCRYVAETEFGQPLQAQRYARLFETFCGTARSEDAVMGEARAAVAH